MEIGNLKCHEHGTACKHIINGLWRRLESSSEPRWQGSLGEHLQSHEHGEGLCRKVPTMHCARHSFAVLALTKGMPIESVSRILGHTNITTTQIYAKITMQKLNADMDDLEKQLHDLRRLF